MFSWFFASSLYLLVYIPCFASTADAQHGSTPLNVALPETNLPISSDAMLEEGKAFYENGQYLAALGKFMGVLRKDPHQPEARQYLRMVIDVMRENPGSVTAKYAPGGQAVLPPTVAQDEIRKLLRDRSVFTLDLKAIPGVQVNAANGAAQVEIDTSLLFADNTGGLREQGVPVLDRVAVWLKTYGQQPVIIHCYPEELQDPSVNGSLFLHRYSELYNFFVEERKLAPQRFVSADLLVQQAAQKQSESDAAVHTSTSTSRILIETVGANTALLDAMPSANPNHALSRWLELSIMASRGLFNPEEGEWASLDLAALTRTGLKDWSFSISPLGATNKAVLQISGKGNLLKRISWDGHDQKSGSFVPLGQYLCRLSATDSDGMIKAREITLQVERTTADAPVLAQKPKKKPTQQVKAKKAKLKPIQVAKAPIHETSSPLVGEDKGGGAVVSLPHPPSSPLPAGRQVPPTGGEGTNKKSPAAAAPNADSADDSNTLLDAKSGVSPQSSSPADTGGGSPTEAPGDDSKDTGDAVHAIWKQVIEFESDKSELKPTLKASLERIGKTLEVYPLQKVRIVGFAAASEQNAAGLALRRAETVRSILVEEYHVDAKRVIVAGGKSSGGSKVEMSITN